MRWQTLYSINCYAIAAVWLSNGLVCKVLGLVPRHEQIVTRILGPTYAHPLTIAIGVGEVAIGGWVWSRHWPRQCAAGQIGLILTMNVLETVLARDLLLWGRANLLFAVAFCGFIGWNALLAARTAAPRNA